MTNINDKNISKSKKEIQLNLEKKAKLNTEVF